MTRMATVGTAVVMLLMYPGRPAHTQTDSVLTNDGVIRMTGAKLSPEVVADAVRDAANVNFDLSPQALIDLRQAGVHNAVIAAMQSRARYAVNPKGPAKSTALASVQDPDSLLKTFKTMYVNVNATYFREEAVVAAFRDLKDFPALGVTIVTDQRVADVVLDVSHTFPWDFPFTLRHQNSSIVLKSGKGSGAFSGPRGAKSVAEEVTKILKPFRSQATPTSPRK